MEAEAVEAAQNTTASTSLVTNLLIDWLSRSKGDFVDNFVDFILFIFPAFIIFQPLKSPQSCQRVSEVRNPVAFPIRTLSNVFIYVSV